MKNIEAHVEDDTLPIRVDLIQEHSPTAPGTTAAIASIEGNGDVPASYAKVGPDVYYRRRR